jgi:hypothetical protein
MGNEWSHGPRRPGTGRLVQRAHKDAIVLNSA